MTYAKKRTIDLSFISAKNVQNQSVCIKESRLYVELPVTLQIYIGWSQGVDFLQLSDL